MCAWYRGRKDATRCAQEWNCPVETSEDRTLNLSLYQSSKEEGICLSLPIVCLLDVYYFSFIHPTKYLLSSHYTLGTMLGGRA